MGVKPTCSSGDTLVHLRKFSSLRGVTCGILDAMASRAEARGSDATDGARCGDATEGVVRTRRSSMPVVSCHTKQSPSAQNTSR